MIERERKRIRNQKSKRESRRVAIRKKLRTEI
jgi:hypothetical protein